MTFYFVVDSEGEDRQVYAADTQADAHRDAVHQGWLIENWKRIDLHEWIKVSDKPSDEQIADWVAPLSVDDVNVRAPGTHPGGREYWIEPRADIYFPVYASGAVILGDYRLDDWFAADQDLSADQVSELVNRFQDRVEEIIGERLIDPEVTRSSDPSAETSGPEWLVSIIEEVETESHGWVAGEDA
jgi:hypothetical protein